MGIFTALAIAAAIGAGGAAISNKQRRSASDARNALNKVGIPAPANVALDKPTSTVAGAGTPQGSTSRPRGRAKSQTTYTSTMGLSSAARSNTNLKVLTGE